jgi:hypothetical protein
MSIATNLDAVKATENLHRALHAGSFPASHRFELLEDIIKATAQVSQHMVCVTRETMRCMNCGCCSANQNGIWQDSLKACC